MVLAVWDRVIKVTHNAGHRRQLGFVGIEGQERYGGLGGGGDNGANKSDSSIGLTVSLFGVAYRRRWVCVRFMASSVAIDGDAAL